MQNTAELMGSKNYFTSKIQYFFSVTKLKQRQKICSHSQKNNGFLSVDCGNFLILREINFGDSM